MTGHEGKPVIIENGNEVALSTINNGPVPIGVLVKGGKAGETVSVAIAAGGFAGTVRVKLGASVAAVNTILELFQTADGCTFVPNSGVGTCYSMAIALETGVADEKIEAILFRPQLI